MSSTYIPGSLLNDPALTYAGTSGHSGTDTSEERARTEDSTGVTSHRQRLVLAELSAAGTHGLTVANLRHRLGLHHGQASAALTNLHRAGRIARLAEKRNRCHVYFLPKHVDGSETQAPTRNKSDESRLAKAEAVKAVKDRDDLIDLLRVLTAEWRDGTYIHKQCAEDVDAMLNEYEDTLDE